jgi:hypothetical protein
MIIILIGATIGGMVVAGALLEGNPQERLILTIATVALPALAILTAGLRSSLAQRAARRAARRYPAAWQE